MPPFYYIDYKHQEIAEHEKTSLDSGLAEETRVGFVFSSIMQKCERYNLPLVNIFIDYTFDSVECQTLWKIFFQDGMPLEFVDM